MYTKPIVYKVYSFIIAISCVLAIGGTIVSFFSNASAIFSPFEFKSVIHILAFIVSLAIYVWFGLTEFTMMYTFSDMVAHELKDDGTLFKKKLGFSGKVYRLTGSLVFYAVLMVSIITFIVLTLSQTFESGIIIVLPLIPLALIAVVVFFVHIVFNTRYNAFGAVLDIKQTDDPKIPEMNRLKESNPNLLRAFTVILFAFCAITIIGAIITCAAFAGDIAEQIGCSTAVAVIATICSTILSVIEMAILGCFFDNLAKMQEHYMIKYKLI